MEVNDNGDAVMSGVAYTGKVIPSGVINQATGREYKMILETSSMQFKDRMALMDDHGKNYESKAKAVIGLVDDLAVIDHQLTVNNATLFKSRGGVAEKITDDMQRNVPYEMSIRWDGGELYTSKAGDIINGITLEDNIIIVKNAHIKETTMTLAGVDNATSTTLH
jgi:hypothetical protein